MNSSQRLAGEQGLLPQAFIASSLRSTLRSQSSDSWTRLQQQRPISYQDCLSYWLSPLTLDKEGLNPSHRLVTNSPKTSATGTPTKRCQALPDAQLYWQQLYLTDNSLCSELIVMCYQQSLYISCLNLLPASFGLYAPLQPKQAMQYIEQLLQRTLNALRDAALASACQSLVTTLINPNLAALFKRQGFRHAPGASDIVGLPLPARFYRTVR